MKQITIKDLEREGFEIVEITLGLVATAPVDLKSIEGDLLDDLDYGTYDIVKDKQELEDCSYGVEVLFALTQNGENILTEVSLECVKEYLNDYFEKKEKNFEKQ